MPRRLPNHHTAGRARGHLEKRRNDVPGIVSVAFSTTFGVVRNGLRYLGSRLRARAELPAKVLLLEKQVAMYEEAEDKPRKTASRVPARKDRRVTG